MPTVYDISLKITYLYDSPAAASRTLLRMLPRSLSDQNLLYGVVTSDPAPGYRLDDLDFFGNATTEMSHDIRLSEITFSFSGRVRRWPASGGLDLSPPWTTIRQEVAAIASIAPESPHHFLGASPRLRHEPEIAAFARATVDEGMSALAAITAVSHRLHEEFTFDPEATEVTTTPIEAFRPARAGHSGGLCLGVPAPHPARGQAAPRGGGCDARLGAGLVRGGNRLDRDRPHQRHARRCRSRHRRHRPGLFRRRALQGVAALGRIARDHAPGGRARRLIPPAPGKLRAR